MASGELKAPAALSEPPASVTTSRPTMPTRRMALLPLSSTYRWAPYWLPRIWETATSTGWWKRALPPAPSMAPGSRSLPAKVSTAGRLEAAASSWSVIRRITYIGLWCARGGEEQECSGLRQSNACARARKAHQWCADAHGSHSPPQRMRVGAPRQTHHPLRRRSTRRRSARGSERCSAGHPRRRRSHPPRCQPRRMR